MCRFYLNRPGGYYHQFSTFYPKASHNINNKLIEIHVHIKAEI